MQKRKIGRGFTLIELMVVLVIIAIFAAIAVPQLVDVRRRNKLTDLTNMVQQTAGEVRTYAMQTRRATVFEVSAGRIWINVLQGPECWSDLRAEDRCMQNFGASALDSGENSFDMLASEYVDADAYLCGVEAAYLVDGACAYHDLGRAESFALCYSAKGDLYYRAGADAATACSGPAGLLVAGTDLADRGSWNRMCYYRADAERMNGAVLKFNRFDGVPSDCDSDALGVMRSVIVPVGTAPYSKVEN